MVGAILIGGAVYGGSQVAQYNQNRSTPTAAVQETDGTGTLSSETVPETVAGITVETESDLVPVIGSDLEAESEIETESEALLNIRQVADEEYPELLEGNLTKEELEFVLAYGPEELAEAGLTDTEYTYILNQFGQGSRNVVHLLTEMDYDANYRTGYLVDEINRLFSVFTDYQFTEENDTDSEYGLDVDGDIIWYSPAELSWDYSAAITETFYTEDKMIVYYDFAKTNSPDPDVADIYENKAAVLDKTANGNFQIVLITEAASVNAEELLAESGAEAEPEAEVGASEEVVMIIGEDTGNSSEETAIIIGEDTGSASDTGMTDETRTMYEQVLQDVADGKYTFPSAEGYTVEGYYYIVTDMDGDSIPELIVGVQYTNDADVFYWHDCLVFDIEAESLVQISGDIELLSVFLSSDGSCFYAETWYQRGTGMAYIDQVTIQDGALQADYVYEMNIQDEAYTQFCDANKLAEWTDINDLSGLDDIQNY
ncbi:MAG: hypothetical protein LUF30_04600 [Lachnospiraceae bacterium]|nr:hypothetical protein [Lachnospiraceae bacterium]